MPRGRSEPRATTRAPRRGDETSRDASTLERGAGEAETRAAGAAQAVTPRSRRARARDPTSRASRTAVPETAAPNPGRARTGVARIAPRTAAGRVALLPAVQTTGAARTEAVAIALVEHTRRPTTPNELAARRAPRGSTASRLCVSVCGRAEPPMRFSECRVYPKLDGIQGL
jgi:hypothetical protein